MTERKRVPSQVAYILRFMTEKTTLVTLNMDTQQLLKDLESEHVPTRGVAAFFLRDSFEDAIGDRLIRFLVEEQEWRAFKLACEAVVPKWIVKLERYLDSVEEWPLDSTRTIRLVFRLKAGKLPSLERRLPQFLLSDDWKFKLAAVEYCLDKAMHLEVARQICCQFSAKAVGSDVDRLQLVQAMNKKSFRQLSSHVKNRAKELWD